jgi:hypothetical protein
MAENCFNFVSSSFKFVMEVTGNQFVAARHSEKMRKMAGKSEEVSHEGREGRKGRQRKSIQPRMARMNTDGKRQERE